MKKKLLLIAALGSMVMACEKNSTPGGGGIQVDTTATASTDTFNILNIKDTYADLADYSHWRDWGPYNLHDPSIMYTGDYYYCYSTDVAYGQDIQRSSIMVRRSKDLVDWEYQGWAVNGLPSQAVQYIKDSGGTPFDGVWAPYIMKVGNQYRLYYSLSSPTPKLSAIGLLTSTSPDGPWTESGLVVTSKESIQMTNAIDPTVLVTPSGDQYMYYGSAWDGIYILQLDPATGLPRKANDKGVRIAARGWTGNTVNGNIEGPEIIYNQEQQKYYLFISYDWLETKYNVRVGRSDSPTGPFVDFNGVDMNEQSDNIPMIEAPYKFMGHAGWQGTAHCSVFKNNGVYYMANQGRPVVNKYFMDMMVRRIFWTDDGWPVVSPERYANIEQSTITKDELTGQWERIVLGYQVVPGYGDQQTSPDLQESVYMKVGADGSLDDDSANSWTFSDNQLTLNWSDGTTDKVVVSRGYDWENHKKCLVFTGLNNQGTAIWGKK
ncbi:arabinan endo-1,5-alpha-L-arabinosidase [Prolixibacter sp. NT017]|uniref:arabinan endo-1,5-alpha-L-arabinosidase n=1 Tax=Prolixibacter sp. NT017 TaxID=2652390 RepID=UPI001286DB5B|nr:arabinan endo-1,5-alpha-L-arabinosidase [Prolixibacter sp. NT017]GET26370.1 endo-arabinase [Prolixibacter sp. NT017]